MGVGCAWFDGEVGRVHIHSGNVSIGGQVDLP